MHRPSLRCSRQIDGLRHMAGEWLGLIAKPCVDSDQKCDRVVDLECCSRPRPKRFVPAYRTLSSACRLSPMVTMTFFHWIFPADLHSDQRGRYENGVVQFPAALHCRIEIVCGLQHSIFLCCEAYLAPEA